MLQRWHFSCVFRLPKKSDFRLSLHRIAHFFSAFGVQKSPITHRKTAIFWPKVIIFGKNSPNIGRFSQLFLLPEITFISCKDQLQLSKDQLYTRKVNLQPSKGALYVAYLPAFRILCPNTAIFKPLCLIKINTYNFSVGQCKLQKESPPYIIYKGIQS